jgi:hypothetical protein
VGSERKRARSLVTDTKRSARDRMDRDDRVVAAEGWLSPVPQYSPKRSTAGTTWATRAPGTVSEVANVIPKITVLKVRRFCELHQ